MHDTYGYRHTSGPSELGVAVLVIAVLMTAFFGKPVINWYSDWKHDRQIAQQLRERLEIQHDLTRDPNRTDGNAIVVQNGTLYHSTPKQPQPWTCSFRCAVAVQDGNAYKVTLPVGFVYEPGSDQRTDNGNRYKIHRISELTYWSPTKHKLVTIKAAASDKSITLPSELILRRVHEMQVGERGYIDATSVVETAPGKGVIYGLQPVVREPGSILLDSDNVEQRMPVERTKEDYVVCMPKAGPLIYDPEMKLGHPDKTKPLPARFTTDC